MPFSADQQQPLDLPSASSGGGPEIDAAPAEAGAQLPNTLQAEDVARPISKRMYITEAMIMKYGRTMDCGRCWGAPTAHSEECRIRISSILDGEALRTTSRASKRQLGPEDPVDVEMPSSAGAASSSSAGPAARAQDVPIADASANSDDGGGEEEQDHDWSECLRSGRWMR